MANPPGRLLAAVLLCRRDPSNSLAWEQLLAALHPAMKTITARLTRQVGLTSTDEQLDLMQEVCMKLSRTIHTIPASALQSETEISAYLRALIANTARDKLRARFADKRGATDTIPLEDRLPQLASELDLQSMEHAMLLRQVDELLEGSTLEKAAFWLYFRQGFTAKEIAAIPTVKLSMKGVESLLHRMTENVRRRIANRFKTSASSGGAD